MPARTNLVLVLAATATCSALMVPAAAFASHGGDRNDVVQTAQASSQDAGSHRDRSGGSDDAADQDAADDSAPGARADDDGADDSTVESADGSTDDGVDISADDDGTTSSDDADEASQDRGASAAAAPAPADHVKARLVAFDTMGVTWRAGRGGSAVVQYVVRLVPASGSTLTATVDGDARSARVGGLSASTRYRIAVTSVAGDGSVAAATAAGRTRTQAEDVAAKATRRDADRAATSAERAQKAAAKAQHRLEHVSGDDRVAARTAAKTAHHVAHEARSEAKRAGKEAARAERRAKAHREDD